MKEIKFKAMFIDHIHKHSEYDKKIDELGEFLGVDNLWDNLFTETYYSEFDRVTDLMFNEDGVDWFNWAVLEKECNFPLEIEYHGSTIILNNIDDLFYFLKQFSNIKLD